jgi:hypothetical protein
MRKKMMKRNVWFLTIVFALLCVGGCSDDNDGNSTPSSTPNADGTLTVRIPMSIEQGETSTRVQATAPIQFTNDLGNGYMLESTLTVNKTPQTRVTKLKKNVTVLMLVIGNPDKVSNPTDLVGYELLQADDNGALTFEVPSDLNEYKLVFFSLNTNTFGKLYPVSSTSPSAYFSKVNETWTSTADIVTGKYFPLPDGATLLHPNIPLYASTGKNLCDALCSSLTVTVSGGEATIVGNPTELHLKHLLTNVAWQLIVDGKSGEAIKEVSAGLYPMHATAQLSDLMKVPDRIGESNTQLTTSQISNIYTATDSPTEMGGDHWHKIYTAAQDEPSFAIGNLAESEWFAPVVGADAYMHLYTLDLWTNNSSGTSTTHTCITDYDIPMLDADGNPISFEPGHTYQITSRLTAKVKPKFAYSNIFWDGTNLNFYVDQTTLYTPNATFTAAHPNVNPASLQGVFFRWGSLVAITPGLYSAYGVPGSIIDKPDPNGPLIGTHTPSTAYDGTYQPTYFNEHPISINYPFSLYNTKVSSTYGWSDFTRTNNFVTAQWASTGYHSTDGNDYGDVCAYLTNGKWRLPTSWEMDPHATVDVYTHPFSTITDDCKPWDTSTWLSYNKTWQRSDSWQDITLRENDEYYPEEGASDMIKGGAGYSTYVSSGVQFPAAGVMGDKGTFNLGGNNEVYYWTSSAYNEDSQASAYDSGTSSYTGWSLYMDGTQVVEATDKSRLYAMPVRCVRASGNLTINDPVEGGGGSGFIQ